MSSGRRFASWNIFDSGLTKDSIGHHYWEIRSLADELVRNGDTVRLFTHKNAPTAEQFPGVEIVPTFSLYLYAGVTNDPAWSGIESFIVHNRAFHFDLLKIDPARMRDAIALFPTVCDKQLLGVFRWMGSFPQGAAPKTAACLMLPKNLKVSETVRMYRMVWERCPPALKQEIALFSRTPQIAKMLKERAGLQSSLLPLILPEQHKRPLSVAPADAHGAMTVSYVGGSRREKGAHLIPETVKRCASPGVRFVIQAQAGSDAGFDIAKLIALAALPNVAVKEGTLSRDEYYSAMIGSVALLPYNPRSYSWEDSSVYHEAKLLDVPVLVTAGTWMADEVKSARNGLVIEDFTAAATADCIARAQRELPTLRANAARIGEAFRAAQGVTRCLAAIAGAFDGREQVRAS